MLVKALLLAGAFSKICWAGTSPRPAKKAEFDVNQALSDRGFEERSNLQASLHSGGNPCSAACVALQIKYGQDRIFLQNSTTYNTFTSSYWSNNQADVRPTCVFKPADADAVSILVLLATLTQCPFAVKSGGHASFPGASSIQGGITVALDDFKGLTVSDDRKTVAVEPGNSWGPVYETLGAQDLIVIGGRVFNIGVGGLTTGGGISFFSNLYGWACDNVESYEVVVASGEILTASPTQNEDLFFALRGGGGNFGIVIKFNLHAYDLPGGELWGGTKIYTEDTFPAVVHAFTEISNNAKADLNAGSWVSWISTNGTKIAGAELWYGRKDGNNASIFAGYNAIPAISDDTQNRKLSDYAAKIQVGTPAGFREYFYVMTIKNDEELNNIAKNIFFEEVDAIATIPGAFTATTFQSITVPQIEQMAQNGSNPLGLKPEDGPLTLILLNPRWNNAEDDAAVYTFGSTMFKRIKEQASARGLTSDYLYMNYAAEYQDVISSYGEENKARLHEIARKYDPVGVFQRLSPGYFKLDRAPTPGTEFFSF